MSQKIRPLIRLWAWLVVSTVMYTCGLYDTQTQVGTILVEETERGLESSGFT